MANDSSTGGSLLTPQGSQLVSAEIYSIVSSTIAITTACVVLLGMISNLINITIFGKMGPNTSANICFLALSVCDFFNTVYITLPAMNKMPFIPQEKMFVSLKHLLVVTMPMFYIAYAVGAWITTIINMERSCAVVFPLKVKRIFTTKSVTAMIISMVVYVTVADTPYIMSQNLVYVTRNGVTKLVYDQARRDPVMSSLGTTIAFTVPTYFFTVIVIAGTIFLITSYEKSRALRRKMTGKDGEDGKAKISSKDARVVKSVILICVIYIAGFSIGACMPLIRTVYPGFRNKDPIVGNVSLLLSELTFMFQAVSCSVNIFIYLTLNSNYKNMFNATFRKKAT